MLSPSFAPLTAFRRFVTYALIPHPEKPGKTIKRPTDVKTGRYCKAIDPSHQYSYEEAVATGRPVGFVFDEADGFFFVDIDSAHDGKQWSPLAVDLCNRFAGCAIETSQSHTGLHIIGRGVVPPHACRNIPLGLELYTHDRFVALTDLEPTGDCMHDATAAITQFVVDFFPPSSAGDIVGWTDEPVPEWDGPKTDTELLEVALKSGKNTVAAAFGPNHVSFADLWNANEEALSKRWPGDKGAWDGSAVDAALASHLAFWTGKNCERIRTLMMQSALTRDKWEDRPEWLETTIMKACALVSDVARGVDRRTQRLREDRLVGDNIDFVVETSIMTLEEALSELVFISDGSWVVSRSAKTVRKYADALKEYAASKQDVFTGGFKDGRPVVKPTPIIKLWVDSVDRRTADTVTWAPGKQEFCFALEKDQAGERAYNLWTPPRLLTSPLDWRERVVPFLQHVEYLIPIEEERRRFLQWVAHIFQCPGELPHTAYLMVATETGIGRGTLASILTRTLPGYVAANMSVESLFGGFNGRISQKLLATVDEIREGNAPDRYSKAESLKSKITEEIRQVNRKYGLQSIEKNCCRWLMFSNHMDALPFDNNDRRIIVISNPTFRKSSDWYEYLHKLMKDGCFIASLQNYFNTMSLEGFNPHEPAPINEAKRAALAALESPSGRLCREFVEQWPGELATRSDLVAFIGADFPHGRALDHDIQRSGMRTARAQKVSGKNETILIVRGPLSPEDLSNVARAEVAQRIISARKVFQTGDGHAG